MNQKVGIFNGENIACVLAIIVIVGVAWYWYTPHKVAPIPPVVNAAATPLYPDAAWGTPFATTSPDYGTVVEVQSKPLANITNVASVSMPFTSYYQDKLTTTGWTEDMNREADGPGSETEVYTRGNEFIVVMFSSVFHNQQANTPEQCPCDLQLTLMSGTSVPVKN